MFFPYQRLSFQIKDLEIRKFGDKYLLCIFSHNKFSICRRMASWGTRDPRRILGLNRLVDSRVVLILCAVLGHFMRLAR